MKIEVNVEKKYVFLIIGAILVLAGAIFGYAGMTGTPNPVPNPGHSLNDIGGPTCLVGQALTYNASGWACMNIEKSNCNWNGYKCHCNRDSGETKAIIIIGLNCVEGIINNTKVMKIAVSSNSLSCPGSFPGCNIYSAY